MHEVDSTQLATRLTAVETAVAHLQHDFEQLHQVALAVQQEQRRLAQLIHRLERRLDALAAEPERRTPESERPPHY